MATTYHDNVSPQVQYVEAAPTIRTIGLSDLHQALRQGWEDFKAVPSHAIILCVIYPVLGLLLARATFGYAVIPLLFPLAAGFALLGPFAALGLYELSARRERGQEPSASDALDVLRSPSFGAMLGLGTLLLALFVTWIATAQAIYVAVFGYGGATSASDFVTRVLTTSQGWWLIIGRLRRRLPVRAGRALHQRGGLPVDARSPRQRRRSDGRPRSGSPRKNPVTIAAWGLIVAALLVAGSLPFFLGLAVVIPLLGHATWHLYRKVDRDRSQCAPDPAAAAASAQAGRGLPGQPVPLANRTTH